MEDANDKVLALALRSLSPVRRCRDDVGGQKEMETLHMG